MDTPSISSDYRQAIFSPGLLGKYARSAATLARVAIILLNK